MAVKIRTGTAATSLSLAPLLDVVFLLLIFFLVTTRFAQEDHELDVLLPAASEAQPLTAEPKELFVNIDEKGTFLVNGTTVQTDELEEVMRMAVTNNPVNQSCVIRADRRVEFQFVVTVMNLCNKVGIRDYTVSTEGD